LVGGAAAVIGFMTAAVMPIFARRSGKQLESIFKKTRDITLVISVLAAIFTYFVAWWVIRLAYGVEYLPAVPLLRLFSVLIILTPLLGIYRTYFTTEKKTRELAWLIIGSAILNIIFNVFGITYGLNNFGEMGAVYGACFATILSRILFVVGAIIWRKK
jgi:O-antigen/teichoic acid export membrane protein